MQSLIQSTILSKVAQQFVVIHETESIRKASEKLGISQPALSINLKKLEERLGFPLFKRATNGMRPTRMGNVIYNYANSIINASHLLEDEIYFLANQSKKKLRIGLGVVWTSSLVSKILEHFQKEFHDYNFDFITGVAEEIAIKLKRGEIDIMIAAETALLSNDNTVVRVFLNDIKFVAICGDNNKLALSDVVRLKDISKAKVAAFQNDSFAENYLIEFFGRFGLKPPKVTTKTNSAEALISILINTENIAFVLEPMAKRASTSGLKTLKTDKNFTDLAIYIYYEATISQLFLIKKFTKFVQNIFKYEL